MSNEPKNPADPAAAAEAVANLATTWMGRMLTGYLEAVVDIDRYTVTDVTGHAHEFRTALPMRHQLATSLRVERFVAAYTTPALAAVVAEKANVSGWRAALRHFLEAATEDPNARRDIQAMFQGCHPRMLAKAQQQAEKLWEEDPDHELVWLWKLDGQHGPPDHVLDLFEADAVLEALVPFFVRFVRRSGQALRKLTKESPDEPSPPSSPPTPSPP